MIAKKPLALVLSIVAFFSCTILTAQLASVTGNERYVQKEKDSTRSLLLKSLFEGYFPIGPFKLDLRYLIKYNQYEGLRTGLGGETNDSLSEVIKVNGYLVYGLADQEFKYSIGSDLRLEKAHNVWLKFQHTEDLEETGSTHFITDRRLFQFFEPRLFNISLFHKHITNALNLEYTFEETFLTEIQFAVSNINPTYNYTFVVPDEHINLNRFRLSYVTFGLRWSPFIKEEIKHTSNKSWHNSIQFSQYIKGIAKSDLTFTRLNFKSTYNYKFENGSFLEPTATAGYTFGNTPITHMFHASPNNITKERLLQRFSVAGLKSFETMYFDEFFSDRLATFQIKYGLKPFKISNQFKPQLVFASRYAIGNMSNTKRHVGLTFNTLSKGYTESTIELNKILFGFGLSFSYRYGAYHLPDFEDNLALKFTFNLTL